MIHIVDYGLGNIGAFLSRFNELNIPAVSAKDAATLSEADHIILPGVGSFDHAMNLLNKSGMRSTLDELVLEKKVPVLGICVGMQILGQSSDEGEQPGLGWIGGKIRALECRQDAGNVPLPHMGWNDVNPSQALPLLKGMQNSRFYFLHSYYFDNGLSENCGATANYGGDFTCIVNKDNVWGVQFHPEKSHHFGSNLLKNFAEL